MTYSSMLLPELDAVPPPPPPPPPDAQLSPVQVPAAVVCTSAWSIAIAAKAAVTIARIMKTMTRRRLLLVAMLLMLPLSRSLGHHSSGAYRWTLCRFPGPYECLGWVRICRCSELSSAAAITVTAVTATGAGKLTSSAISWSSATATAQASTVAAAQSMARLTIPRAAARPPARHAAFAFALMTIAAITSHPAPGHDPATPADLNADESYQDGAPQAVPDTSASRLGQLPKTRRIPPRPGLADADVISGGLRVPGSGGQGWCWGRRGLRRRRRSR